MSIPINDTLAPRTSGYSLIDDADVAGGLHVVADVAARDAIPAYNLKVGMVVYTQTEDKYWVCTSLLPVWNERFGSSKADLSMAALGATAFSLGQITDAADDSTYGDLLAFTKDDLYLTGARFFWPGGHGALNVKVSLWDSLISIDTAIVSVDAAGIYQVSFAAPIAVTPFITYRLSVYAVSSGRAIYVSAAQAAFLSDGLLTVGFLNNRTLSNYIRYHSVYALGDALPLLFDLDNILGLVEPVF